MFGLRFRVRVRVRVWFRVRFRVWVWVALPSWSLQRRLAVAGPPIHLPCSPSLS